MANAHCYCRHCHHDYLHHYLNPWQIHGLMNSSVLSSCYLTLTLTSLKNCQELQGLLNFLLHHLHFILIILTCFVYHHHSDCFLNFSWLAPLHKSSPTFTLHFLLSFPMVLHHPWILSRNYWCSLSWPYFQALAVCLSFGSLVCPFTSLS